MVSLPEPKQPKWTREEREAFKLSLHYETPEPKRDPRPWPDPVRYQLRVLYSDDHGWLWMVFDHHAVYGFEILCWGNAGTWQRALSAGKRYAKRHGWPYLVIEIVDCNGPTAAFPFLWWLSDKGKWILGAIPPGHA